MLYGKFENDLTTEMGVIDKLDLRDFKMNSGRKSHVATSPSDLDNFDCKATSATINRFQNICLF